MVTTQDEVALWMDSKVTKVYLSILQEALTYYRNERSNGGLLNTANPYITQSNMCLNQGRTEAFSHAIQAKALLISHIKSIEEAA